MKQAFKKSLWLWVIFGAFALSAVVLQSLAILLSYEPDTNYFAGFPLLPLLAIGASLLAAIVGSVAALLTNSPKLAEHPFPRLPIPSLIALGMILPAIAILTTKHTEANLVVIPATVASLFLSAVYPILVGIAACRRHRTLTLLFGMVTVISCILLNAYYYFDISVEMNAPLKTTLQGSLLFLMLYLTAELRYLLGTPQPRLYLALAAWALAFGSLSSIPLTVAFFAGKLTRLDYVAGGLLLLCAAVTICHRIVALHRSTPAAEAEEEVPAAKDIAPVSDVTNENEDELPLCNEEQDTEDRT